MVRWNESFDWVLRKIKKIDDKDVVCADKIASNGKHNGIKNADNSLDKNFKKLQRNVSPNTGIN